MVIAGSSADGPLPPPCNGGLGLARGLARSGSFFSGWTCERSHGGRQQLALGSQPVLITFAFGSTRPLPKSHRLVDECVVLKPAACLASVEEAQAINLSWLAKG